MGYVSNWYIFSHYNLPIVCEAEISRLPWLIVYSDLSAILFCSPPRRLNFEWQGSYGQENSGKKKTNNVYHTMFPTQIPSKANKF